mmetsp:Transcript_21992/g.50553  ORF Transcript_21992/g.50553 Transcript_21992/m.50553 type:complete len:215 (-) Transcript_21992:259-903(-)
MMAAPGSALSSEGLSESSLSARLEFFELSSAAAGASTSAWELLIISCSFANASASAASSAPVGSAAPRCFSYMLRYSCVLESTLTSSSESPSFTLGRSRSPRSAPSPVMKSQKPKDLDLPLSGSTVRFHFSTLPQIPRSSVILLSSMSVCILPTYIVHGRSAMGAPGRTAGGTGTSGGRGVEPGGIGIGGGIGRKGGRGCVPGGNVPSGGGIGG